MPSLEYHLIQPGDRFWRWTVIGPAKKRSFRLRCDCGSEKILCYGILMRGRDKSCGCLRQEMQPGGTMTPTRRSWSSMRSRCSPSTSRANYTKYYKDYGVTVCDRWQGADGFANFLADMGPRPKGKTLDRYPDPNGNYEPTNCRWATPHEQTLNKRNNIWLTYKGQRFSGVREACIAADIDYKQVYNGIYRRQMAAQDAFDLLAYGLPLPTKDRAGRRYKLTEEQVETIRTDPRIYREIAVDYNISTATVSLIKQRRANGLRNGLTTELLLEIQTLNL